MAKRKIALFGGTFDPIHLGHTVVAASAREALKAECVVFIPAKHSPLKKDMPLASDRDRLKMISLAIADEEGFEFSDYEVNKSGISYTIDTILHFREELGSDVEIHWLIGADNVKDLPLWYRIEDIIDNCYLSVMYRAGYDAPDFSGFSALWGAERVEKLQDNVIETPLVDISSTEIRRRLAKGQDVSGMLKPAVLEYIFEKGLYGAKKEAG